MATNNKISNIIASQVPAFVRDDHATFVQFLEAYYEWLETDGQVVERAKNLSNYYDIDATIDGFTQHLHSTFLKLLPEEVIADKALILKHVKDFYRARGTEKSIKFLLRILFGNEVDETNIYYPKLDILKASDGKWFIERALKFEDVYVNGVANTDIATLQNFKNKRITGNSSGATALVESVSVYYDQGTLIKEIKISNLSKDFYNNETIYTLFDEGGYTKSISTNTFGGIINSVMIQEAGSGYDVGDEAIVTSNSGTGAIIEVSKVTSGNVKSLVILDGGAGYQVPDFLLISGGGGSGANANVITVDTSGTVHPNSYNISYSTIELEANTPINNTIYSNLNPAITDPANDVISNSQLYFTYSNTGPVTEVFIIDSGTGYSSSPDVSVLANTRVREAGILGRMEIISGGIGYSTGDKIQFINVPGGYGSGAQGNVITTNAGGTITQVAFEEIPGFLIGGEGYSQDYLPLANVISGTGSGANIAVTAILGYGAEFQTVSDTLGAILSLAIINPGTGYTEEPTLDLSGSGDSTAQANAQIITGVFSYPGRYINDDGHVSGYNFLQNRDYYQNFSYVVRTYQAINRYRKYLKDLIHPAGLKLFGEHLKKDENAEDFNIQGNAINKTILIKANYISAANANGSRVEIYVGSYNTANMTTAYIEFISGNAVNVLANGIFTVTPNIANSYITYRSNTSVNGTGNVYTSI